jgi:hypothetical protein
MTRLAPGSEQVARAGHRVMAFDSVTAAPFRSQTTNVLEGTGFAENSRSDGFLAADDFHRFITNNDSADQRAQICFARGCFAVVEQVSHEFAEPSDPFRVDAGRWQDLRCGVVISRLSLLAVGFEFDDSLSKEIVEFDDAFLDPAIETLEAIFGIDNLGLQRSKAAINGGGALLAPGGNRGKQFGQTFRREHVFPERRQNQFIQGTPFGWCFPDRRLVLSAHGLHMCNRHRRGPYWRFRSAASSHLHSGRIWQVRSVRWTPSSGPLSRSA